jgi:hypothetical protein
LRQRLNQLKGSAHATSALVGALANHSSYFARSKPVAIRSWLDQRPKDWQRTLEFRVLAGEKLLTVVAHGGGGKLESRFGSSSLPLSFQGK